MTTKQETLIHPKVSGNPRNSFIIFILTDHFFFQVELTLERLKCCLRDGQAKRCPLVTDLD